MILWCFGVDFAPEIEIQKDTNPNLINNNSPECSGVFLFIRTFRIN